MKYLIVDCDVDYEVTRTPIKVVDDYKKWYFENKENTRYFEVYQIDDSGDLHLIKDYDTFIEQGMALYYWLDNDIQNTPHILYQEPNKTRNDDISSVVKQYFGNISKEDKEDLQNSGYICKECIIDNEETYLTYGEYFDNNYSDF